MTITITSVPRTDTFLEVELPNGNWVYVWRDKYHAFMKDNKLDSIVLAIKALSKEELIVDIEFADDGDGPCDVD